MAPCTIFDSFDKFDIRNNINGKIGSTQTLDEHELTKKEEANRAAYLHATVLQAS